MSLFLVLLSLVLFLFTGGGELSLLLLVLAVIFFYRSQSRKNSRSNSARFNNPSSSDQRNNFFQSNPSSNNSTTESELFHFHTLEERNFIQRLEPEEFVRAEFEAIIYRFIAYLSRFGLVNENEFQKLISLPKYKNRKFDIDALGIFTRAKNSTLQISPLIPKDLYNQQKYFDEALKIFRKIYKPKSNVSNTLKNEITSFFGTLIGIDLTKDHLAPVYLFNQISVEFPQIVFELVSKEKYILKQSEKKRISQLAQLLYSNPEEAIDAIKHYLKSHSFSETLVSGMISSAYYGGHYGSKEKIFIQRLSSYSQISDYEFKLIEGRVFGHDYLSSLISLCAKMSKVDGRVTRDELRIIKDVILKDEFELTKVNEIFTEVRDSKQGFEIFAFQIREKLLNNQKKLLGIIEGLFFIATSDGNLSRKERQFIDRVSEIFQIPHEEYRHTISKFADTVSSSKKLDPYKILGVKKTDSDRKIKKVYRKLQREYHPDMAIAQGMPKGYLEICNRKIAEINKAYDKIKELRKVNA